MSFQAVDLALDAVRSLRSAHARIARADPDLARQLRRSISSVALNLSEARRRRGKDRLHLFRVAAGSAAEARTCLQVAEAWGTVRREEVAVALDRLDRVLAITWTPTH